MEILLDFTGNLINPTAPATTEKSVFNSVVSTPGSRYLLGDMNIFYLKNISLDPEIMLIPLKIIPHGIIDAYNLTALIYDQGWTYMRIEKGMYGLKKI